MKRGLIFLALFAALIIMPGVLAQASSCYLDLDCTTVANMPDPSLTYTVIGYFSNLGHFSDEEINGGVSYSYRLCCPDQFILGTGDPAFEFSKIDPPAQNGTGHVAVVGTGFSDSISMGTVACTVQASCSSSETCIFNVSGADNSHVGDCYASDVPVENDYPFSMCCKLKEYCYDGIDNDLDGFIDCTDQDCFGGTAGDFPGQPQECTNIATGQSTWMNTSACAIGYDTVTNTTIFNASCIGQAPPPPPAGTYSYYCGFGAQDDPVIEPTGVCCQYGKRPMFVAGAWQCADIVQCGAGPLLQCKNDFGTDTLNWDAASYSGNPTDWCNTKVPNLYVDPKVAPYDGSTGCCLIPKFGEINYYLDKENVKVWG